jgi:hypothetical protein
MNPATTHPDYDQFLPTWLRARDVIAGEDAIRRGAEMYLPRLDSQTDADYDAYKTRASFFNATARSAAGYIGLIFRRAPFIKLTPQNPGAGLAKAMGDFSNDLDLRGTSLYGYAKNLVTEIIQVGRAGTLIDWNDAENRPYASLYKAESILNWRTERINGRNTLALVTLAEPATVPTDDPFVTKTENRIRVLRLVAPEGRHDGSAGQAKRRPGKTGEDKSFPLPGGEGQGEGQTSTLSRSVRAQGEGQTSTRTLNYRVELWGEVRDGESLKWQLVESHTPKRLGKPLTQIPFVFHGPIHSRPEIDRPPLDDVIALNLDHYRLDADYKHGVHFTALPTVWVAGFDPDSSLKIGSTTAWISSTVGASAGYLEFTGQGLQTFERAMERDERLMAILGSRLLETQKRVAETAEALQIRHAGEESILTNIATSVSESITQVLRFAHWWLPSSGNALPDEVNDNSVVFELNTDFGVKGLTARELQAIVAAWQAGAISQDTMFELFRKGEILPDGRSNSEELSLLATKRAQPVAALPPSQPSPVITRNDDDAVL